MSEIIRVKPTQDGTYTVYRGARALVSGLTRAQAELFEASLGPDLRPTPALAGDTLH
ncbi:hypothetical protein [uncultured Methylobacterium sp.]|jgi:hypothetical protein|uniref:hypothetical protein n=1 Tax=uncultured Methylobacterium sp. TaxID=157278 RepID=UPI0026203A4E|nr:hypothetical protein [uncultured Methylobacterium sp.]